MSRISLRRKAAAAVAVAGLYLAAAPSASFAHTFSKSDANDSPGRLDIRTASVGHKNSSVVHSVKTYEGWKAGALGDDSFFIVAIDTNFDDDFERCAFIYFAGRLRGGLTNCERNFIRTLAVAKPSKTVAKVTMPGSELPGAYRWVVFSYWSGATGRCADLCFDAAPNRPPPILHDLTPPQIDLTTDPLVVWDDSTTPDFVFPFTVSDEASAVSWDVESRSLGSTSWTTVSSGNGEGSQEPAFIGVLPGQYEYRVVAVDSQANRATSPTRLVYVPTDVDADTGPGTIVGGVDALDAASYGGSYVALDDVNDTYSINIDHPGGPCRAFAVIGSGSGSWNVDVSDGVDPIASITHISFPDQPRLSIYSESICADATRIFTVTSGTGFGVDAVLI